MVIEDCLKFSTFKGLSYYCPLSGFILGRFSPHRNYTLSLSLPYSCDTGEGMGRVLYRRPYTVSSTCLQWEFATIQRPEGMTQ